MRKIALLIALLLIVLGAIPALSQVRIKLGEQPMAAGFAPYSLSEPAAKVTPQAQTPYQPMGAGYAPNTLPPAATPTPTGETPYQPMGAGYLPGSLPGSFGQYTK